MKKPLSLGLLCVAVFLGIGIVGQGAVRVERSREEADPGDRGAIPVPKPTTGAEGGESASASPGDVLSFINGDRIHGTLASIDQQSGVTWQHRDATQPIPFKTTNISRIHLRKPAASPAAQPPTCSLRLTNGDELLGNLVSVDAEKATLDTWYGGKLLIQRRVIQAITPLQGGSFFVYEGPTGLDGWTTQRNNRETWKYQNGVFSAIQPGPIGRDFKLPNMVNIEFDLSWRGYLQFMISVFTDSLQDYGGNAYMLNLNNNYVYLQRMTRNGGSNQLGQAQVQALGRRSRVRLSIRVNKEQRAIALLADGHLVQQWRDPAEFAGKGTGVVFFPQGPAMVRISNIRITEWDGRIEEPSGTAVKSKEDTIKLANNDKVSGTLQTIQEKKIAFATSYATLEIPMERVQQIELASVKSETVKPGTGDLRLHFVDRGSVTMQLERWDRTQIAGSTSSCGKVKFNPAAFQLIQFNLDKGSASGELSSEGGGDDGDEDMPIPGD